MEKPPTSPKKESDGDTLVVPVIEEEARISKRTVERAKVLIERRVETEMRSYTEDLTTEGVEVRRVPIDQPVDGVPQVREEGDEIVVPVLEERLVVRKQVFLKEEVRIRRIEKSEPKTVAEEIRTERVDVRREEMPSPAKKSGADHPGGGS